MLLFLSITLERTQQSEVSCLFAKIVPVHKQRSMGLSGFLKRMHKQVHQSINQKIKTTFRSVGGKQSVQVTSERTFVSCRYRCKHVFVQPGKCTPSTTCSHSEETLSDFKKQPRFHSIFSTSYQERKKFTCQFMQGDLYRCTTCYNLFFCLHVQASRHVNPISMRPVK